MTAFAAILSGALSGFGGAAAAHLLVTLANRAASANAWLKGPYGPPFFDISLFMGIMYGAIAWGLLRRRREVLVGLLGPFLGIAVPMMALTRLARWDGSLDAPDPRWVQAVVFVFIAAVWGTIFGLGFRAGRWKGALAMVAGAFAGYLVLTALLYAAPGISQWAWRAGSLWPQPTVLLDGLLTGGGMGLGLIFAARRRHEKASDA
jgi:hypothetical protein